MSLTTGRGPLSGSPAGRFSQPLPPDLTYVEPCLRRVRAVRHGVTVVDSERVLLLHRPGRPPTYAFPNTDVGPGIGTPAPAVEGYVIVAWDAVDSWYEEEEQVFGHPRNPYHRVDCIKTNRRLRVEVGGTVLVDTTDTLGVYETALAPRLYVRRNFLHCDLEPSPTTTYCPYKGTASYWTAVMGDREVRDIAWSYEDPHPECASLRSYLGFDETVVMVTAQWPEPFDVGPL